MRPHRQQPTRLPYPWDSPSKNTGVGCHFLLHCMKLKRESEIAQSCPTLRDPVDCSPPGSSVHGVLMNMYKLPSNAVPTRHPVTVTHGLLSLVISLSVRIYATCRAPKREHDTQPKGASCFKKNRWDYFFADAAISALIYMIHVSFLHSWICSPWESSLLLTDNKETLIACCFSFLSFYYSRFSSSKAKHIV